MKIAVSLDDNVTGVLVALIVASAVVAIMAFSQMSPTIPELKISKDVEPAVAEQMIKTWSETVKIIVENQ